jgi:hypothetical protein
MAFYYHMYICDTAFGFIQAQVHPSTGSQQISMLQLDSMYCIMLKTITTNIAITSSVRKLDALRSCLAQIWIRKVHSVNSFVTAEREREHISGVIDERSWWRSVAFRCGAALTV